MAKWILSRRRTFFAIIALVVLLATLYRLNRPTPESVMADFFAADDRAEDMLMDPLILNADVVAHAVIRDVRHRDMPRRRYAIAFLGNQRIEAAVPTLRSILNDETELDYFRADALDSVFRIDRAEGERCAKELSLRQDYLGYVARGLLNGSHVPVQRSRWQAMIGYHE
jgi:hypothetical protein